MVEDIPIEECAMLVTDINRDRVLFDCDDVGAPPE